MMMSEFIERTGFEPTADEYSKIEEAYYEFDGNKDEFCKIWKKNGGIERTCRERAQQIERLKSHIGELERDFMKTIHDLEAKLEREQEWKPYESDSNVKQADYERLASCGKVMNDTKAIDWVCDEFGFDPAKVRIVHAVPEYEVNRHNQLRRTGKKIDRSPVYDATDYNYVRFDVANWMYECWGGELRPFYD